MPFVGSRHRGERRCEDVSARRRFLIRRRVKKGRLIGRERRRRRDGVSSLSGTTSLGIAGSQVGYYGQRGRDARASGPIELRRRPVAGASLTAYGKGGCGA